MDPKHKVSRNETFYMHATLMWNINDTYADLLGGAIEE